MEALKCQSCGASLKMNGKCPYCGTHHVSGSTLSFLTHNEKLHIDTNMTHLQGYINVPYRRLVEMFGKPTTADEYKIDVNWDIEFSDGKVATVYNWKNGKNYLGEDGLEVEEMTEFNIGGKCSEVAHRINQLFAK